jgi:hypothetical protein
LVRKLPFCPRALSFIANTNPTSQSSQQLPSLFRDLCRNDSGLTQLRDSASKRTSIATGLARQADVGFVRVESKRPCCWEEPLPFLRSSFSILFPLSRFPLCPACVSFAPADPEPCGAAAVATPNPATPPFAFALLVPPPRDREARFHIILLSLTSVEGKGFVSNRNICGLRVCVVLPPQHSTAPSTWVGSSTTTTVPLPRSGPFAIEPHEGWRWRWRRGAGRRLQKRRHPQTHISPSELCL